MHVKINANCPLCRSSLKTINILRYQGEGDDLAFIRLKYERQLYILQVSKLSSYEELFKLICDLFYLSADHVKLIHKNKRLNSTNFHPSMLVSSRTNNNDNATPTSPPRPPPPTTTTTKNTSSSKQVVQPKLPLFQLIGLYKGKQKYTGGVDSEAEEEQGDGGESFCIVC
jgi:hypothetical protein